MFTQNHLIIVHGLLGALECLHDFVVQLGTPASVVHLLGYGDYFSRETNGITLAEQADHVAREIERRAAGPSWVLGHSVGGAVSMFLAEQRPDLVHAVINIEGNFTLKDAFWSRRIAAVTFEQWTAEFDAMKSDTRAWLQTNNIAKTPEALEWATSMLQREQPASTIHNMARAVIAATSPPDYLQMLHRVFARTPVHLVAGARSASGWDVPDWARAAAASYHEIPNAGHMMMLEQMTGFLQTIRRILDI